MIFLVQLWKPLGRSTHLSYLALLLNNTKIKKINIINYSMIFRELSGGVMSKNKNEANLLKRIK